MGSYGAKWRHGWIPLNAAATALKLKRLKAGSSEGFHGEAHGHSIHVGAIHGDDTRHAALVVNPKTGRGHYSVHANSDTAYQAAHEHAMRLQDRLTKREAAREMRDRANAKAIVSQRIGGSADNVNEPGAVKASSFSKQEMMLPGVRERNGEHIIVRPSAKMHNAGHRFPKVGVSSPMVEHDQFGVEHGNGAHIGHIDTNGGLHITGPGMERHQVSNVNQAVAGLHANYTIRERERAAAKTAEQAKADSEKAAMSARVAQSNAENDIATKILGESRTYKSRSALDIALAGKSPGERMAHLKSTYAADRLAGRKAILSQQASHQRGLFKVPAKPKPTKADSPTMQANRDKVQRALERSPLSLSNGDNVTEAPPVGTPVEHGGRAGHVVGVYGSTFDTYHPPTEGANGFYMRHEIRTRRGRKYTQSNFGGHSGAKAS